MFRGIAANAKIELERRPVERVFSHSECIGSDIVYYLPACGCRIARAAGYDLPAIGWMDELHHGKNMAVRRHHRKQEMCIRDVNRVQAGGVHPERYLGRVAQRAYRKCPVEQRVGLRKHISDISRAFPRYNGQTAIRQIAEVENNMRKISDFCWGKQANKRGKIEQADTVAAGALDRFIFGFDNQMLRDGPL